MQIKKLEFRKAARDTALHTADAFGWFYEVWHFVDAGRYRAIKSPNKDLGAYATMEAAEAACQNDFNADVLTLIDTRPSATPLKHPQASFANCLRHAFFTGAGYDSLEKKITDDDQRRWCEYDPPRVGSFVTMEHALDVAAGSLPSDPWSTDLDAAPEDVDVLTLDENGKMRVAYKMPGKVRNAFCSGMSARGGYVLHSPVKWRALPDA